MISRQEWARRNVRENIRRSIRVVALPIVMLVATDVQGGSAQRPATSTPSATASAIPRLANGKPDLNGVWEHTYVPDMTRNAKDQIGMSPLPFTPAGEQRFKAYDPGKFDYTGHCLPQGMTRSMNAPFPIEFVQTPTRLAVLFEAWNIFHVVPLDGRQFPKSLEPTWTGTSIGRWDRDTLVIETRGFNGKTNLDTVGHPHSDQLRLTQRFTRTDATHMAYEVIVDDPVTYSKPWANTRVFTLRPDWEILEYSCMENNKDLLEGHIK